MKAPFDEQENHIMIKLTIGNRKDNLLYNKSKWIDIFFDYDINTKVYKDLEED